MKQTKLPNKHAYCMGVIFFIYFQLLLYSTDSRMYFFITWRRPQSNPLPSPAIRISDIKWLVKAIELCKRNTNPKANDPADLIWTQKCSDKTKTVSGHTDVRNEQLRLWSSNAKVTFLLMELKIHPDLWLLGNSGASGKWCFHEKPPTPVSGILLWGGPYNLPSPRSVTIVIS